MLPAASATASYSEKPPRWLPGMTAMQPFSCVASSIASQTVQMPSIVEVRPFQYDESSCQGVALPVRTGLWR